MTITAPAHNIKETAATVVRLLKEEGFSVLRNDSITSNSVYLKVDYGVCNTIRISDHPSIDRVFTFNLLEGLDLPRQTYELNLTRHYFPIDLIHPLIEQIKAKRQEVLDIGGPTYYRSLIAKNLSKNLGTHNWNVSSLV